MKERKSLARMLFAFLLVTFLSISSVFMIDANATTVKRTPAKVPFISVTVSGNNKTRIIWSKARYATKYRLYYRQKGQTKWTTLADVDASKTSYMHISSKTKPLNAGKSYMYTIRAYNKGSKTWSGYCTVRTVTMPKAKPTPKPTATPTPKPTATPTPIPKPVKVNSICVIPGYVQLQVKQQTCRLDTSIYPRAATNQKVIWASSNPKIATVNQKGVVTANSNGIVVITAKATDGSGIVGKCYVSVKIAKKC